MIRTYAELQTAISAWLARSDLKEQVPEFVQLAEAEIARRLRRRTVRASLTIAGPSTSLPSDCTELRSIRLVTGAPWLDGPLSSGTVEMLNDAKARSSGVVGRPLWFAVVGGELLVAPEPDDTYTADVTYYERLVPLATAVGGSNSVLAEAPDLYLYGALREAAPYLQHDERLPLWESRFSNAIAQLELKREREESAASLRPARLPVVFG